MISLEPSLVDRRRILFVDAFDSFTNNIIGLLEQCLDADVSLVHINDAEVNRNLEEILDRFDAVVVGPGPGHPAIPSDVGFINKLWKLHDTHVLPILGICLGFQSLCFSQGAAVKKLQRARHGIVSTASHGNADIFAGTGDCVATQYHSLHADLGFPSNDDGRPAEQVSWEPSESCPSLQPLAWDVSDGVNGPILMSVRHTTKPFWGVQFHPESICTSEAGRILIENWWMQAREWSFRQNRRGVKMQEKDGKDSPPMLSPTFNVANNEATINGYLPNGGLPKSHLPNGHETNGDLTNGDATVTHPPNEPLRNGHQPHQKPATACGNSHLAKELRSIAGMGDIFLRWGNHPFARVTPTSVLEALGHSRDEVVLLDSQGHASGRYSILGLIVPGKTLKVTYRVSDRTLRYGLGAGQMFTTHVDSIDEVWPILDEALQMHNPRNQDHSSRASSPGADAFLSGMDSYVAGRLPEESPFWGGFMGYISYEAGLETIDVELHPSCATGGVPDINFAFIHRSIVIDHQTSQVYIQSLLPGDWTWILNAGRTIDSLACRAEISESGQVATPPTAAAELKDRAALDAKLATASVSRPTEATYRAKVLHSQEFLSSGDSYELCLTDETEINVPVAGSTGVDEWSLYKRLRSNNPAPFGAFVRLSDVVVVGSSPERFLNWTRHGRCQFRPIKGTVKKSADMTRERAHAILGSSKERAENLMIVDLIRHDLSGVVGAANTWVSKLMVVEEYQTVYQLVSVIEGQLPSREEADGNAPRGIDVLKASLPPGSMTGAPKKRSCEILSDIERRPRGVYSGVLGYMDVGGAGDFSVVIRTLVRGNTASGTNSRRPSRDVAMNGTGECGAYGDSKQVESWRVGAGGAVTIQSTDEGEFVEMETKASSVLGALFPREKR